MHALEAFITPITTFGNTHNWYKIIATTGLQILSQVELLEVVGAKLVEEFITQPVIQGQSNLGLWVNILKGKMLSKFAKMWPNKLIK